MKNHYQGTSQFNSLTKRCEHQCGSDQETKKQSIEKEAKPCPLSEPPQGKHHQTKQHAYSRTCQHYTCEFQKKREKK